MCSEDPTVTSNPGGWPALWASLMKDVIADDKTKNRVFVDLLNEPDHAGFRWENVGPNFLFAFVLTTPPWHEVHAVLSGICTAFPLL